MDINRTPTVCFAFVLFVSVLLWNVNYSHGQDLDIGTLETTIRRVNNTDMLRLFVDLLADKTDITSSLKETVLAAFPILHDDVPHGWFVKVVLPWLIKHLPDLLRNDEFRGIAKIFITELNRHDQDLAWFPDWVLQSNDRSAGLEYVFWGLMNELDFYGMAADILSYKSVRDFFPYNSTDRQLNEQCYEETMAFADRLLVGEEWALNSKYLH